jgi:hypothetical protein
MTGLASIISGIPTLCTPQANDEARIVGIVDGLATLLV